jgi:cbb3-type cytochrome oxidase maturation protein
MSAIFILIAASITIAIGFLIAFIWSVKDGQYEDDYTPSVRMLFDDELIEPTETIKPKTTNYGTGKI